MVDNEALVGMTFPPTTSFEVSAERIQEFAAALGLRRRGQGERSAEGAPTQAPVTFLSILWMSSLRRALDGIGLGIDLSEVVHRDQRFTYSRPVLAGDVLAATVRITRLDSAASGEVVTTVTEIQDARGNQVCTVTSTIVTRASVDRGAA